VSAMTVASCFTCAVFNKSVDDADPIGVCRVCNALACFQHGTRLKKGPQFQCALCLPRTVRNSAYVVRHETYGPPPGGGGGGGRVPVPAGPPDDDDGGGALVVEFESSEDFERSAPQIAEASRAHRMHAREDLGRLLALVTGLDDAPDRQEVLGRIIVTSDVATFEAVDQQAAEVGAELRAAQAESRLDPELLADAMGVAAWAIGAEVGDELSVDAIEMIPDRQLQFLLRASNFYARASA
jgi:hypothetical protein